MEKHTVFVPSTKEEYSLKTPKAEGVHELREDAHLMTALRLSGHQLLGFLMYLLINISAGSGSIPPTKAGLGSFASHLYPLGNLFISSQKVKVVVSGLSIATMVHPLALVGQRIGWGNVLLFYFLPYVWVNHWIVVITYLLHTHPSVPHYGAESWIYTKRALAMVDRSLGFIGRHFFHEIVDFHLIHQLLPKIPFYKAEEET